jgi:DNA-binding GntR family transcriptional regulator
LPEKAFMLERSLSTVDQVILAIKLGIRDARYVPAQRLAEPDLAREYGVSRGSVREALRRLAAEGLVNLERFRGASIIRMSRKQVVDLLEIREVLEGFGASLAAQRADDKGRLTLVRLEKSPGAKSELPRQYDNYNNEFHDLILAMSGNAELPGMLNQIRLPIFRLQFNRILLLPEQIKQSRADHNAIVKALLKGNPSVAERTMRQHIRHQAKRILSAPKEFFA